LQGKIDAKKYMSDNKINELMEYLLNSILVERPDNPNSFLVSKLNELKTKSTSEILNRQDIETMYDLIDVTGKGSISLDQLIKCLENLRVDRKEVENVKNSLQSDSVDKIDRKKFFLVVSTALNILRNTPYSY
jgi:Ca2+-binding EF-hand superfamily protein